MLSRPIARRTVLLGGAALALPPLWRPARAAALPVLDFRFTQSALPPGIRFKRASAALVENAGGLLVSAAIDEPRFAREPGTGKAIGLLIEGGATNYARQAGALYDHVWQPKGAASIAAAPEIAAPDGGKGAARIHLHQQKGELGIIGSAGPVGARQLCCLSVYLKRGGAGDAWALNVYDFGTYHGQFTRQTLAEAWQRATVPIRWSAADAGNKLINLAAFRPEAAPDEFDEAFAWGCQLELGRGATSLIPTGTEPAERAPDIVEFDAAKLSRRAGVLRLELPRGGVRGGTLLDTENAERDGIRLAFNDSGWLTARIGGATLAGTVDATADTIVELAWDPGGATLSGGSGDRLRRYAYGKTAPVACGESARLLARLDGTAPLNAVLGALSLAEPTGELPAITTAATVPSFVPAGYRLVFGDDFTDADVARINENATGGRPGAPAWRSRYRHDRFEVINQEKQIYMDRNFRGKADHALGVQPFAIRNGVLTITADRADPVAVSPSILNFKYTSGCITSELTHWQTYGYFEMRARLPLGKGFFPAFWLLPKRDVWPPEIDIFEASGARPDAVHLGVLFDKPHVAERWIENVISIADGFHVYGLEWTEQELVWSFDGQPVWHRPNDGIAEDMYILANLALGNRDPKFIPDPDETTPFPGHFEIDYIRAYQRD